MRVWVTGATGMLGRRVVEELKRKCNEDVHNCPEIIAPDRGVVMLDDIRSVMTYAQQTRAEVIINCAGVTPRQDANLSTDIEMVIGNALIPHHLAAVGIPVIHMSTDCVFSGVEDTHYHSSNERPDPDTLYGRSKLLGEVKADHVMNVRSSFVDWNGGLLRWLIQQVELGKSVMGWQNATWTGGTASAVAKRLVNWALTGERNKANSNVVHLAAPLVMSKYRLLEIALKAARINYNLIAKDEPRINRALRADVQLPDQEDFMLQLAVEYQEWSRSR